MALTRWVGRAIGLDVHRDFCVVAICEDGRVRSVGRVPSTPEGLTLLAESLGRTDRVALEVTGSCWEVARILEPHVDRVVVVSPDDTGISRPRLFFLMIRRPPRATLFPYPTLFPSTPNTFIRASSGWPGNLRG